MVTHVLKDGTILPDIKGHVVKIEDAKELYILMQKINKKGKEK